MINAYRLVGIALLLLAACVPFDDDDGGASLTFENGTNSAVIVLWGRAGTDLGETLAQGLPVPPIQPGGETSRSLGPQNASGEWCSPGDLWILQPDIVLNEQSRSNELTVNDVTVIEKFEGGPCWGTDPAAYFRIE